MIVLCFKLYTTKVEAARANRVAKMDLVVAEMEDGR
jgi:hypothetical protein